MEVATIYLSNILGQFSGQLWEKIVFPSYKFHRFLPRKTYVMRWLKKALKGIVLLNSFSCRKPHIYTHKYCSDWLNGHYVAILGAFNVFSAMQLCGLFAVNAAWAQDGSSVDFTLKPWGLLIICWESSLSWRSKTLNNGTCLLTGMCCWPTLSTHLICWNSVSYLLILPDIWLGS